MNARIFMVALATATASLLGFVTVGTAQSTSAEVAAYAFDAGSGTTAVDASGHGNAGTLSGGAAFTGAGKYSGAASFNGTTSKVSVSSSASLNLTSGMTLEAWVRPTGSESGHEDIIVKASQVSFPYGLELTNGVPDAYVTSGTQLVKVSAQSKLPLNTWSFVAATYAAGGTFHLYVAGSQVGSVSSLGNLSTSAIALGIGGDSKHVQYFTGSIDNVRVYNTALTASQVTADSSSPVGSGTTTTPPVDSTPPSISGSAQVGGNLAATTGAWSGSPTGYGFQWQDCNTSGTGCVNITGATSSSYMVASGDVGHTIVARVTATNAGGSASAVSSATATVPAPQGSAPANTAVPKISGTTTQGDTLSATSGSWSGSPTSMSYQWQDCNSSGGSCSSVAGATATTYVLQSSDVAATVRVVVTAANAGGSTTANSAVTAAIAPSGTGSGGPGGGSPLCSPSPCTSGSYSSGSVSVSDGGGKTVTRTFQYSAPNHLVLNDSSHQVPLVFMFRNGQSNGEQTEWLTNSGSRPYAVVYFPVPTAYGGSSYATPTVSRSPTSIGAQSCGPSGTATCDDIPAILAILHSVECIGALPCMNVDPSQVYFTGASGGGTGVEDVMCDERTSALAAAYLVESNSLIGLSSSMGSSPDCPALGQQCLWAPSCTGSTNKHARILWVYGTDESPFSSNYCSVSSAHDCLGVGYAESAFSGWFDGTEQLAGCTTACATPSGLSASQVGGATDIIGGFLGCPQAPSLTSTFGSTGKLTYRDHAPCSSGGETATIQAYGGPHMPQGTDGLDIPLEGWKFFTKQPLP